MIDFDEPINPQTPDELIEYLDAYIRALPAQHKPDGFWATGLTLLKRHVDAIYGDPRWEEANRKVHELEALYMATYHPELLEQYKDRRGDGTKA